MATREPGHGGERVTPQQMEARIAELEAALWVIVRGATRTMGTDSTGRAYAHVRQVMLDRGRVALGMPALAEDN
jgi:hypothetical protein